MQSVSPRIWTRIAVSISYNDDHCTTVLSYCHLFFNSCQNSLDVSVAIFVLIIFVLFYLSPSLFLLGSSYRICRHICSCQNRLESVAIFVLVRVVLSYLSPSLFLLVLCSNRIHRNFFYVRLIVYFILFIYIYIYILTWLLLDRVAFVPDGVSKSMADSMPKGLQFQLGHLRVGELQPLSLMYSTRPCCLVQAITQHTCPDPDLDSWNCLRY